MANKNANWTWIVGGLALLGLTAAWAAGDLPTKFTNRNSIANTRHNLTQRPPETQNGTLASATMNSYRNDYNEICVYCHTPHGANRTIAAPLWNRTNQATAYQTYQLIGADNSGSTANDPGANSLTCLSCHDGTVAIDSIINIPGSGRYSAAQETSQSDAFLNDNWNNAVESAGGPDATVHMSLNAVGCLACHSTGAGILGAGATDFTQFLIGTDLRNDHPVGIVYPTTGPGVDFIEPTGTRGSIRFFDTNGNGRPDSNEIRLYNTGQGDEVECATCHDPHGVPSAGQGSKFFPTFLRKSNAASALCLTCHNK